MEQERTLQLLTWMENVIAEQQLIVNSLLEMALPKRRAIIADDIPGLQQIASQEEKLLVRLQELEQIRLRVINELNSNSDNSQAPIGIEAILTIARQQNAEIESRLKTTIDKFTRTYSQLVEANQQNAVLIQDALDYIDNVIKVISGSNEGVAYSSQGEMGEVLVRRYLNKKV